MDAAVHVKMEDPTGDDEGGRVVGCRSRLRREAQCRRVVGGLWDELADDLARIAIFWS